MSYIKKVHDKPRLYYYLEYGRHHARLHRRRRAYAPTSNTASHDYHQKINSWVSFCFLYGYRAPLGGPSSRRSSAMNHYFLDMRRLPPPKALRLQSQAGELERNWGRAREGSREGERRETKRRLSSFPLPFLPYAPTTIAARERDVWERGR